MVHKWKYNSRGNAFCLRCKTIKRTVKVKRRVNDVLKIYYSTTYENIFGTKTEKAPECFTPNQFELNL